MGDVIKLSEKRGRKLVEKIELIRREIGVLNTKMSRVRRTIWLCIFEDYVVSFSKRESALRHGGDGKLAVIPVEIDCEIGEGLERN